MKTKKIPVEIDYFIWNHNAKELAEWTSSFDQNINDHFKYGDAKLEVKTIEGTSYVVPYGYVIIRGVQGEYYPCDPKIFKETYEISGN